ncbi:hypothetical protein [Sinomicrobium sp. M5D2P17]
MEQSELEDYLFEKYRKSYEVSLDEVLKTRGRIIKELRHKLMPDSTEEERDTMANEGMRKLIRYVGPLEFFENFATDTNLHKKYFGAENEHRMIHAFLSGKIMKNPN